MESDLHQIIVSPQQLTEDHVKVFIYQVLRGMIFPNSRVVAEGSYLSCLCRLEVLALCRHHTQVGILLTRHDTQVCMQILPRRHMLSSHHTQVCMCK
jgi:hypothetical protein